MIDKIEQRRSALDEGGLPASAKPLIYRQVLWTRITHWIWAVAMFFLLLSGLQIFNAHPTLYIGNQSGFGFSNEVLAMGSHDTPAGPVGYTRIFGKSFNTTGVLGLSAVDDTSTERGFPSWATIPSYQDLGTGRVVHFFFAWMLVITFVCWFVGGLINGHIWRDLIPKGSDLRNLPRDVADHAKFRFHHARDYSPLQKLAYGGVLFVVLPLIILTGLTMSPAIDAAVPHLADILGGRQTARTIHFCMMLLLVGFFVVHVLMVVAAGPFNELRSIITGWYRIDPPTQPQGTPRQEV